MQITFTRAILEAGVHKRLLAAEIPHLAETGMAPIRKNGTPRFSVTGTAPIRKNGILQASVKGDDTHDKKRNSNR